MDASKLTNGNGNVPPAKNSRPAAVRTEETKKVDKRATGKKAKTERDRPKGGTSKSDKLVCRYCESDDLAPSFIKRRDRRCRKCFSKRYGSAARRRKTKVKK